MSDQPTSTDLGNVTFSQALAAGLTHSGWLESLTTRHSGQALVLANHSVSPGSEKDVQTSAIYDPLFGGSSPSAGLQESLANKLRVRMDASGSPELDLTWKSWDMPSGDPICALRASEHRTEGNGCSGWPTPRTPTGGPETAERKQELGRKKIGGGDLAAVAKLTPWPTPNTMEGGQTSRGGKRKEEKLIGGLMAWPSPQARDYKGANEAENALTHNSRPLNEVAKQVSMTPGRNVPKSSAGTENTEGYHLNPFFVAWLMGFPPEWTLAGLRAHSLLRRQ